MIPCGACGSYALSRSSQRHQPNSLNLRHDDMASTKVLYSALVFAVLAVAAVVALSITVGVYGKQIMDFINKHEPEWYNGVTTNGLKASSLAGDRSSTEATVASNSSTAVFSNSSAEMSAHPNGSTSSSNDQNVTTSSPGIAGGRLGELGVSSVAPIAINGTDNGQQKPNNSSITDDSTKQQQQEGAARDNSDEMTKQNEDNGTVNQEGSDASQNQINTDGRNRTKKVDMTDSLDNPQKVAV